MAAFKVRVLCVRAGAIYFSFCVRALLCNRERCRVCTSGLFAPRMRRAASLRARVRARLRVRACVRARVFVQPPAKSAAKSDSGLEPSENFARNTGALI